MPEDEDIPNEGWLWVDGVPGLEQYAEGDQEENLRREARNAIRIRDFIKEEKEDGEMKLRRGRKLSHFRRIWTRKQMD